jgi:hypothetical protein
LDVAGKPEVLELLTLKTSVAPLATTRFAPAITRLPEIVPPVFALILLLALVKAPLAYDAAEFAT